MVAIKKMWQHRLRRMARTSIITVIAAIFVAPMLGGAIVSADPVMTEYPIRRGAPYTGAPGSVMTGPDGAVWFTEGGKISRINASGTITADYIVPNPDGSGNPCLGCGVAGMTVGPDGNIWFTEVGWNQIGKLTTSGVFTMYSTPDPFIRSSTIVTGPDGALWFADDSSHNIGRVTTSGQMTIYPLPSDSWGVHSLVVGPDGAIWFPQFNNNIGRITMSGELTEYPVPPIDRDNIPTSMVLGPDGAFWFTESSDEGHGRIGRMTTSGVFTQYTVPTDISAPSFMTVGPDGAMWFTENLSGKIGRITTAGSITEYSTPGSYLGQITTGPNGDIWYTAGQDAEADGYGSVGHLLLAPAAPIVHVTNPLANATVSGTVNITGTINSGSAYSLMLYVFNSSSQAVVSRYQYAVPAANSSTNYSWNTTGLPNGTYTIILSAKDAQGNKDAGSTSTVKITVQN